MAIETLSAQAKITVPQVPGVSGADYGNLPARVKTPQKTNDTVVQLFPQKPETETEKADHRADQVSAMVEDLQASLEMLQQKHTQLNFSVHEKTDRVMVRITDQGTGDVIREIPSEEFLDLAARLQEMVGLIFDTRI
jgi:flagellar protein FlaG